MSSSLPQRVAFSVVAIPATIGLVWLGGWALAAGLAVLGALGTAEVYGLARRQGVQPLAIAGVGAAVAIPLVVHWSHTAAAGATTALFGAGLWVLSLPALAMRRGPGARPLSAVAVTVFGAAYASGLLAFALAVRHARTGPVDALARTALVVFPLVLTWLCDTAAMAAGSAIGGRKLAPVLSPRKTWAGAVGGAAAALVAAALLGALVLNRVGWSFTLAQLLGVGLVVGVIGQVGDVAESLFKREAGVKDASALIPGHGGVLDRLDSLYYVIPVSAVLFALYGIV